MNNFEQNVKQIWKEAGRDWLSALPSLVAKIATSWHLTDLIPAPNLSYNYVLFGFQETKPIVLKLGFVACEILNEANALKAYNGKGCVRLLDADFTLNALLLEKVNPGTSLKTLFPHNDNITVKHAVEVMNQLHQAPISDAAQFPTIVDGLKQLNNPVYEPHFGNYLIKARELSKKLLATQAPQVLLHGDLHHDNILSCGSSWIAIDPKGVMGEPAYEVGAFIRNPYPELLDQKNAPEIMKRRLQLFSELLHIDKERLRQWSYVQAVLAACWALEDGQTDYDMALTESRMLDVM